MITITFKDDTPELMQKVEAAAGRFVRKAALHIKRKMTASMDEEKHGRSYERGAEAVHVASKPGESPANDSDNLKDSIHMIMAHSLEALVGTNVEYALYLEEGAFAQGRQSGDKYLGQDAGGNQGVGPRMGGLLPRPMWAKTVRDELPTLEAMLNMEIQNAGRRKNTRRT